MQLRGQQCGFDHTKVDLSGCTGADDGTPFLKLVDMLPMDNEGSPMAASDLLEAINSLGPGPRSVLARELRLDRADGLVLNHWPGFVRTAVRNEKLGNRVARLAVALEAVAKMYQLARKHNTDNPGNLEYIIHTISGEVGNTENAGVIRTWGYHVEVPGDGKQYIKFVSRTPKSSRAAASCSS